MPFASKLTISHSFNLSYAKGQDDMKKTVGFVGAFQKNANEFIRGEFKLVRGKLCFDLRIFEELSSRCNPIPTKKRICVRVDQVHKLKRLLDDAVKLGTDKEANANKGQN